MNFTALKKISVLMAVLFLLMLATETVSTAQRMPNPVIYLTETEPFQQGGKQWTRYKYEVFNADAYPNSLFAAAPDLPPCGNNTKSARTWVEVFDQSGKRLNGFCALGSNSDLRQLWFALESDVIPPSWIYIEFNDRKTNTKFKSNLAETVP